MVKTLQADVRTDGCQTGGVGVYHNISAFSPKSAGIKTFIIYGYQYGIDFATDKKAQGFLNPICMGMWKKHIYSGLSVSILRINMVVYITVVCIPLDFLSFASVN